jgi:cation diffusion facilitator family transporter
MTDQTSVEQGTLPGKPVNVERWGWYSMGINVALIAVNLAVALASGSLAVEAEMVHNIVDLFTAVGVLVGLKLATRKSKAFPYGLYKVENVVSVVLALMTFLTAYEIAREALLAPGSFFAPAHETRVDAWMLAGVVIAAAIPLIFSHFELRAGRASNSPALIADAREYRAHVFTTGVILASLVSQWFNLPLDRIAALVIVVAIGKTGWELLSDGMRVLLDASLDADALQTIRETIAAEPTVSEVKWVTGRNAGRFRFVEAEVALRVRDLDKAEVATQRIETQIREALPFVERTLIHAQPMQHTHRTYAVPLADPEGTIRSHFGEAPYFALVKIRLADQEIEEQRVLGNPCLKEEKAKGIRVAEWLIGLKADVVLLTEELHSKGPLYALGNAGIELRLTEAPTLNAALAAQLNQNEEQNVH